MTGETVEAIPQMEKPQIFVERTLAIIKSDALHKADEIEDIILRSGFTIIQVNSITSMFTFVLRPLSTSCHPIRK